MPRRKERVRVLVVYGGASLEREVSRDSAKAVAAALDRERYVVTKLELPPDGTAPAIEKFATDVVFPVAHGPGGEDGILQGFLDFLGIPYVGSGVLGSAVGMDKIMMKRALEAAGLSVARHLSFQASRFDAARADRIESELAYPCFIKPASLGSSIGVSKVRDRAGLEAAVAEAGVFGDWILAEEAVVGMEVSVGVLEANPPQVSEAVGVIPGGDFYTYADKYITHLAEVLVPAPLSPGQRQQAREFAVRAFTACHCEGMARVDYFLAEREGNGRGLIVNEINTLPGMLRDSLFPLAWEYSGLPYPDLLDRLIEMALARQSERMRRRAMAAKS